MTADTTGGAAFPRMIPDDDATFKPGAIEQHAGMSLRDYFAAAALNRSIEVIAQFVVLEDGFRPGERNLSEIRDRAATLAYSIADAMLKERK